MVLARELTRTKNYLISDKLYIIHPRRTTSRNALPLAHDDRTRYFAISCNMERCFIFPSVLDQGGKSRAEDHRDQQGAGREVGEDGCGGERSIQRACADRQGTVRGPSV